MLILMVACAPERAPSDGDSDPPAEAAADTAPALMPDSAPERGADTGSDADTGADTDAADTGPDRYVIACDDGSGATHYVRFPVAFAVGDIPRAGVWVEYAPGYIATVGDGSPVAAYSPVLPLDGDGYVVAACGWLGDGWMVERYTLVVE